VFQVVLPFHAFAPQEQWGARIQGCYMFERKRPALELRRPAMVERFYCLERRFLEHQVYVSLVI
jgi:hypothetical protein